MTASRLLFRLLTTALGSPAGNAGAAKAGAALENATKPASIMPRAAAYQALITRLRLGPRTAEDGPPWRSHCICLFARTLAEASPALNDGYIWMRLSDIALQ
ncbi:hypothetical protein GCM10011611_64130 [Aliidongia dinghuensis]|uniref:Secreted protein n=1 Tax=Aliidongia dinghuensis TaxID=1867774 RepID=A0A8J2Z049_9PROT|nr:hypothetical protein GCM10011611_64130 [Aliidongia dinghuensis]